MKLVGEHGAKELFIDTLFQDAPWDQTDAKFMFHYTFDTANAYADSGDLSKILAACNNVGSFSYSIDRLVDWCYSNGIDAQVFWDAWLQIEYHLNSDPDVSLRDIAKALDRAVVVIRQLDPLYSRRGKLSGPKATAIEIIKSANQRMTGDELLAAFEGKGLTANSSTKQMFADMVDEGLLTTTRKCDEFGRGYGLPEWMEQSQD